MTIHNTENSGWKGYLMDAYARGDRLGAPFEGYSDGFNPEDVRARAGMYPRGTDETSVAECAYNFMATLRGSMAPTRDGPLIVRWAEYHMNNRAAARYGGTWMRHFALVKLLQSSGSLTAEKLLDISKDENSFGNGCLGLVMPAFIHWGKNGFMQTLRCLAPMVKTTHYHKDALRACSLLLRFFYDNGRLDVAFEYPGGLENWAVSGMTPHALGCLAAALVCVKGARCEDDVIEKASKIGGDVDSYLSLALMMLEYRRQTGIISAPGSCF